MLLMFQRGFRHKSWSRVGRGSREERDGAGLDEEGGKKVGKRRWEGKGRGGEHQRVIGRRGVRRGFRNIFFLFFLFCMMELLVIGSSRASNIK